ncbi:TonB-dependent receptor plug domain-containing protein [Thalassobellus suaedae]|uniref:TonB-dependent receptor plug domain-containing protein n=1 Tax=Thalassobellus suaedae TaxID=3074124 RepID=A0ABY9XU06_9FLAO|nr:TonB-dependent receptor plug domain-containing protein [Flavobacteriaceae bacterium HL-DH14]
MYSKKLKLLTLLAICLTLFSYGQIKIIDNDSKETLHDVKIINSQTNDSLTANSNEYFEILKAGTYILKKAGYFDKVVSLKKDKYYIIALSINPSELNEIIINANHIPKKLKKSTKSIILISLKDIERSNSINFASVLNRTPGIFMQSGALNTNRITIRGIGSRNLFGTAKIRAYFKDIPLTNGSGETNIEDFELASISRFEIIKGTTSSEYGAGLGGTINITPKNAYLNTSSINNDLIIGSFGLTKGIINLNHGTAKNSYSAIYSNTHSDGYRENNKYDRQTFTLSSNHFLTKKDEISFLASYLDLKAFIPSSINESTYINSPKSAVLYMETSSGL